MTAIAIAIAAFGAAIVAAAGLTAPSRYDHFADEWALSLSPARKWIMRAGGFVVIVALALLAKELGR